MLIAFPKEGDRVCPHFGHCEQFALYDTDTKMWKNVDNPGHVPGALPVFLNKLGANLVIAGGMGAKAQELFVQQGIDVIVGIDLPLTEALQAYEEGRLVSTGAVCHEHAHEGHCHS